MISAVERLVGDFQQASILEIAKHPRVEITHGALAPAGFESLGQFRSIGTLTALELGERCDQIGIAVDECSTRRLLSVEAQPTAPSGTTEAPAAH